MAGGDFWSVRRAELKTAAFSDNERHPAILTPTDRRTMLALQNFAHIQAMFMPNSYIFFLQQVSGEPAACRRGNAYP